MVHHVQRLAIIHADGRNDRKCMVHHVQRMATKHVVSELMLVRRAHRDCTFQISAGARYGLAYVVVR